jgi:hypothetical protein
MEEMTMQTKKATYSIWVTAKKSTAKKMADYTRRFEGLTWHEAIIAVFACGQNPKVVECYFSIDGDDFLHRVGETDQNEISAERAHDFERFGFNFNLGRERAKAGMWI